MSESGVSKPMPSRKALEAAAINRLVEMNKGQKVQPSQEAVMILAKMMVNRALRQANEASSPLKDGTTQTEPPPSTPTAISAAPLDSTDDMPPMCSNLFRIWMEQGPEKT